ncbi:SDR family oxidoreductase [Salinarchaeum sp. IM2453]|uniref:oxidoreductase n=1 Tax=Salinarchaeum sp. IM2453 TaxID=2862870 RepID=UPI001C82A4D5|nr:oxidoreductase [Salinarchaeum sp. IM2453]QZA89088.1 SDR family oxidoreductase [Salinarchaeum sp. IM2453]
MRNMFSLSGKTILVTGSCGLVGKEICKALPEFGANVIATDVDDAKGKELEETVKGVRYSHLDITAPEQVKSAMSSMDQIDGVVNTAYPRNKNYGNNFEQVAYKDWVENVTMHLGGYYLVCREAILNMLDANTIGSVVNFGSIYGIQAPDFRVYEGLDMTSPIEYSAIKAGVINFTRYIASYFGGDGIRANVISPGGIYNGQPSSFVEEYESRVPLDRMAETEDIIGTVVYLLSEASSYVTGENIVVDGGWTIK